MILHKLIIPISLAMAAGMASAGTAFSDTIEDILVPAWSSDSSLSSSSPGTFSQFQPKQKWLNDKWSSESSYYQTNGLVNGQAGTSQWTVDIKRRLLSAAEDTYLAMGLGWNDFAVTEGETSSGMRFVAEGRVGIYGPAYLFGQAALSPWMSGMGNNIDPYGKELELGLAVDPLPTMSFRAGYRSFLLDSPGSPADSTTHQTDGFYIGGGMHW